MAVSRNLKRRPNEYIELSGVIFDPGVQRVFNDAVAEGIEELGVEAVGVMMGFIQRGGFVDTGQFLQSVESQFVRAGGDTSGYAVVAPTAVWPEPDRPTRYFAERGVRGGVRLRKGIWLFRNTATRMRADAGAFQLVANKITEALN